MTITSLHQLLQSNGNFAEWSKRHWNTSPDHESNYNTRVDKSFEPIAVVTPLKKRTSIDEHTSSMDLYQHPKKRARSDGFEMYPYADTLPKHMEVYQSPNSLQYPDLFGNICNPFYQRNASSVHGEEFTPYSYKISEPPLNKPMADSVFNAEPRGDTDPAVFSMPEGKMFDEYEPLFVDPIHQSFSSPDFRPSDAKDYCTGRCHDLCGSSSSSLDGRPYIIRTSDSFKENHYAKAEVITGNTANLVELTCTTTNNGESHIDVATTSHALETSLTRTNLKELPSRFKPFHEEKWNFHFEELLTFKNENGHCLVPHTYPQKSHLARWVKRQRRQYKLRVDGNPNSTMTEERIKILNDIGFVWDSHEVIWNERFSQLREYKQRFGNCRVPSYCKECPQLASWVKCQRRQYKLFWDDGKGSSMNEDRIRLLNSIGFIWEVHPGRKHKENEKLLQHIAKVLIE